MVYRLSGYDYPLPKELIAQEPVPNRDRCRLLVLDKNNGEIVHTAFANIIDYLGKRDVLVINDTKVIPARLLGKKATGGKVEVLLLHFDPTQAGAEVFETEALLKASRAPRPGQFIYFADKLKAEVLGYDEGKVKLRFFSRGLFRDVLLELGHVPLPPYIKREDKPEDKNTYQTVYASKEGAVAAPTAGLHFTPQLLTALQERGVEIVRLTLHVGYGTFIPVKVEDIREHKMHGEYYEVSEEAAKKLNKATQSGKRVVAVGTTTTRLLEYLMTRYGKIRPGRGICDIFIYPGFKFKMVQALITNFHLPKSTLIMLVSAFAGRELILKAYKEAIEKKYRFYSYGDAMFIF
ncbi:MAG: tRNA preQ1(34) S-adenosylmethionine ribosyltransferase-isomerase QueA [Candidatus Desulfofervidaceae bacterium]|nr:tRNA preQ1(34) S-adenosylmethionine ribosyltransferase-isomerase QueA [Candidatus Desulfofervidaceae bacterium]